MCLFREDKQVRCNRVELLFCFLSNIDVAFQILLYFCATIKVMYVSAIRMKVEGFCNSISLVWQTNTKKKQKKR